MNAKKECLDCGKTIIGRSDKKFCDHYCRSNYHNRVNEESRSIMRNINYSLRKNRRILLDLKNVSIQHKTSVDSLARLGFNVNCFTGITNDSQGRWLYQVYDMAYVLQKEEGTCYITNVVET